MPQGKYEKYFVDSPKYEELFDEPSGAAVGTVVKPETDAASPKPIRGGKYEKYFDPEEAGTVPHVPLQESAVTLGERTLLQTVAPHDQQKKADWLKKRGYQAQALESGQVAVQKKDGSGWGVIDPHRMEWMDLVDAADEIAFGIASAAGGTAMAAAGPLGLLKAGAGAAIGGASFEAARQAAGAAAGFEQTPGEVLTDVGISGAIGGVVDPVLRGAGRLVKGAARKLFMKGKPDPKPEVVGQGREWPRGPEPRQVIDIPPEGKPPIAPEPPPTLPELPRPPGPPISGGAPDIRRFIQEAMEEVVEEIAGGKLEISTVDKLMTMGRGKLSNEEMNSLAMGVNKALIEAEESGAIDIMQRQAFSEWLRNMGFGKAAPKVVPALERLPKPVPAPKPAAEAGPGARGARVREGVDQGFEVQLNGKFVGWFDNEELDVAVEIAAFLNEVVRTGKTMTSREQSYIRGLYKQGGYDHERYNLPAIMERINKALGEKIPRAVVEKTSEGTAWEVHFDGTLVAQFDDTSSGRNAAGAFSRSLNSSAERGQLLPLDLKQITDALKDSRYSDDHIDGFLSWLKGKIKAKYPSISGGAGQKTRRDPRFRPTKRPEATKRRGGFRTAVDAYQAVAHRSPRAIFSLAVRFAEKWTPNLYKGASVLVNKSLQRIARILEEKGRPAALAAAYAIAQENREFREWLEKQESSRSGE